MTDPRDILAKSPMSAMQVLVVGITIALNALDGFDVLSQRLRATSGRLLDLMDEQSQASANLLQGP